MLSLIMGLSMIIYYPIRKAGIIMDYIGWLYQYEAGSYSDVINSFGYKGLHQVFHLFNYSIYRLVGADPIGQYIIFSLSHGIVVFAFFILIRELARIHKLKHANSIVLFTVLLFLISPYHIEVVTYKACYHYMLVSIFIYTSYYYLLRYYESRNKYFLIAHHFLFVLSLFTLELSLAAPFIYISYSIYYVYDKKSNDWLKLFMRTGLVQLGLLLLYFSLNNLILGDWVGHYGASTHLDIKLENIFGTGLKYFAKQIFLIHFLPFNTKQFIYESLSKPIVYLSLAGLFITIFGWFIYRFYKLKANNRLLGLAVLNFFMAIFPIVTLYFMYMFWYSNDRYGYLASSFLYFSIVLALYNLPKIWRRIILYSYIVLNIYLFGKLSISVYEGTKIHQSLLEDFRWYDAEEVVILSLPYNYQGMYMFVDYTEVANEFREALYWHLGKHMDKPMYGISQFNMMSPDDKIGVEIIDSTKLKVMIGQGGSWFWSKGYGFTNFDNKEFKGEIHGWYYILDIKNQVPGRVYIYTDGDKWKEVKLQD